MWWKISENVAAHCDENEIAKKRNENENKWMPYINSKINPRLKNYGKFHRSPYAGWMAAGSEHRILSIYKNWMYIIFYCFAKMRLIFDGWLAYNLTINLLLLYQTLYSSSFQLCGVYGKFQYVVQPHEMEILLPCFIYISICILVMWLTCHWL